MLNTSHLAPPFHHHTPPQLTRFPCVLPILHKHEDMRRQGRMGPAAPGNDPWVVPEIVPEDFSQAPQAAHQIVAQSTSNEPPEQDVPPHDPSIRIIIEYSDAISTDVASLGSTDSDSSRQPCVELDAAQSSAFRKLAVLR